MPAIFNITLPDFSQTDVSSARRVITFLILMGMVAFTLITLQHENNRAVTRANEAAIAKSDFLANMSHELRTPMNGVLGLTEVLMSKDMPEDQKNLLGVVHTSGQSLLTIINDILDFSKLESGQVELDPKTFNLKRLLEDTQGLLSIKAEEKDLYLSLGYPDNVPFSFVGDDNRLRQIILNVVGNAIKFTKDGGVTITTSYDTGGSLRINVKDTGIGIDPSKFEQIFDQFTQAESSTTRKFGGTGLGLAISRNIARAMGGDITIQSQLGHGSTFTISLPLETPNETPVEKLESEVKVDTFKDNVPVIETPLTTKTHPVIFLSQTEKLMSLFQSHTGAQNYKCQSCSTMPLLIQAIKDQENRSNLSPVIVLVWNQTLEEFLSHAQKIRKIAPQMDVNFLLCLKAGQESTNIPPSWIHSIRHPLSAENMVNAIETLSQNRDEGLFSPLSSSAQ